MGDECQPPEVLILREQDSILRLRQLHYFAVNRTLPELAYRQHIMPFRAQSPHNREVAALIGQKAHSLELAVADRHDRFMGYGVRGVSQASLNIFYSEPRIGIQQIRGGRALGQFSKNQLHGIRVPRTTGLPSMTSGWISIRSPTIR
jgi:hypothetical protein